MPALARGAGRACISSAARSGSSRGQACHAATEPSWWGRSLRQN